MKASDSATGAGTANGRAVVTRFAPSPTGYLHIGGARTALFNWLFARHHGGKYLLRIEDTDRARSTEPAIAAIHDGLDWLGLGGDEPAVMQFARSDRHAEVAQQLLDAGHAYRCYLTQEELAERAGLTPNAIGSLERGEHRHPYPATVRSLSTALGLSAEEHAALAASVPRRGTHPVERGRLPAPRTPLVGRTREVAAVRNLLLDDGVPLLTLTGPEGTRKFLEALLTA